MNDFLSVPSGLRSFRKSDIRMACQLGGTGIVWIGRQWFGEFFMLTSMGERVREAGDLRDLSTRGVRHVRTLRSLYTPEQVDSLLHRERARADRSKSQFALVLFKAPRSIGPSRSMLRLAKTVQQRCRDTDEVGWFDDETVAALLPDTTAIGAQRFADAVCTALVRELPHMPTVTFYSYPSTFTGKGQDAETTPAAQPAVEIRRADLVPFVIRGVTQEFSSPATDAETTAAEMSTPDISATKASPTVAPVELLLAKKMPIWKRAMDIAFAGTGLLFASPFMIVSALLIKLTSPGPIFFKQKRTGLGGKTFDILKFRTMRPTAEAEKAALRAISEQDGPAFKLTNDPRVTKIGKILRETSLDELPQLWNVIRGDMSLVGPRPLPVDEQGGCDQWQHRRLDVTPGLTCIWQIKGRSRVTFDEWVRMDVAYIRRRTIWHDLKLIFQTVPAVVLKKGAK